MQRILRKKESIEKRIVINIMNHDSRVFVFFSLKPRPRYTFCGRGENRANKLTFVRCFSPFTMRRSRGCVQYFIE